MPDRAVIGSIRGGPESVWQYQLREPHA
jgi:hypothetical protein